jgi:hypothetical protein
LQSSALAPNGDDYRLTLTLADGAVIDLLVTFEQLDDLAEDIDRRLDTDDEWAEPAFAA